MILFTYVLLSFSVLLPSTMPQLFAPNNVSLELAPTTLNLLLLAAISCPIDITPCRNQLPNCCYHACLLLAMISCSIDITPCHHQLPNCCYHACLLLAMISCTIAISCLIAVSCNMFAHASILHLICLLLHFDLFQTLSMLSAMI